MGRRRSPDGVEDEGEADVGRGGFAEEFVRGGVNAVDDGDGAAGGCGVEFNGAFDGVFGTVPGGGLGDADQVFEGGGPIYMGISEAGVVDEDGFAIEEAG